MAQLNMVNLLLNNLRGREDPGCTEWTSLTKFPLIGRLQFYSTCHTNGSRRIFAYIEFALSRNGCRNLSLDFSIPYSWIGRFVLHAIFSLTLSTAFYLLICRGSMLARTGSHCVGVDFTFSRFIGAVVAPDCVVTVKITSEQRWASNSRKCIILPFKIWWLIDVIDI